MHAERAYPDAQQKAQGLKPEIFISSVLAGLKNPLALTKVGLTPTACTDGSGRINRAVATGALKFSPELRGYLC